MSLTDAARSALREHRIAQAEERLQAGPAWQDQDVVFTTSVGGPLDGTHLLRDRFHPLLAKAGLPKIRFHDLRHTAATLLLGEGIHPKIVSEMLGHSNIAITLGLYSLATPTMQQEAALALDALLVRAWLSVPVAVTVAVRPSPRCKDLHLSRADLDRLGGLH